MELNSDSVTIDLKVEEKDKDKYKRLKTHFGENIDKVIEISNNNKHSECNEFINLISKVEQTTFDSWFKSDNKLALKLNCLHLSVTACLNVLLRSTSNQIYNTLNHLALKIKQLFPIEQYWYNLDAIFTLYKINLNTTLLEGNTKSDAWKSLLETIQQNYLSELRKNTKNIETDCNNFLFNKCTKCNIPNMLLCSLQSNEGMCHNCLKLLVEQSPEDSRRIEIQFDNNTSTFANVVRVKWFINCVEQYETHMKDTHPYIKLLQEKYITLKRILVDKTDSVISEAETNSDGICAVFIAQFMKIKSEKVKQWSEEGGLVMYCEVLHLIFESELQEKMKKKTDLCYTTLSTLIKELKVMFKCEDYWHNMNCLLQLFHKNDLLMNDNETWKTMVNSIKMGYFANLRKSFKQKSDKLCHMMQTVCVKCNLSSINLCSNKYRVGLCHNCLSGYLSQHSATEEEVDEFIIEIEELQFSCNIRQTKWFIKSIELSKQTVKSHEPNRRCSIKYSEKETQLIHHQLQKQTTFFILLANPKIQIENYTTDKEATIAMDMVYFYVIADLQTSVAYDLGTDVESAEKLVDMLSSVRQIKKESLPPMFIVYLEKLFQSCELNLSDVIYSSTAIEKIMKRHQRYDEDNSINSTYLRQYDKEVSESIIDCFESLKELTNIENSINKVMTKICEKAKREVNISLGECNICMADCICLINRGCCSFNMCLSCMNQWILQKVQRAIEEDISISQSETDRALFNYAEINCPGCRDYYIISEILQASKNSPSLANILYQQLNVVTVPRCPKCLFFEHSSEDNLSICTKCQRPRQKTCSRCYSTWCEICDRVTPNFTEGLTERIQLMGESQDLFFYNYNEFECPNRVCRPFSRQCETRHGTYFCTGCGSSFCIACYEREIAITDAIKPFKTYIYLFLLYPLLWMIYHCLLGDHDSVTRLKGCHYNLYPHNRRTRILIRGSLFSLKLLVLSPFFIVYVPLMLLFSLVWCPTMYLIFSRNEQ